MSNIIRSMLENDLYKLTQQNAVLKYKPGTRVRYKFISRNNQKFSNRFVDELREEIECMRYVALTNLEYNWLRDQCPYFDISYLSYLRNYRFDPNEVAVGLSETGNNLELSITGDWERTILWEVPLLAMISELHFAGFKPGKKDERALHKKVDILTGCNYSDFGTRRRRSYLMQDMVVRVLSGQDNNFMGTSNCHLAHKYNVPMIGTMAHEWIMAISVLESLRHANRYALKIWNDIYRGDLAVALTDTFGTAAFFADFDKNLARLYGVLRHDSGDPTAFAISVMNHYRLRLGLNLPEIIFSDGLTAVKAAELQKMFGNETNLRYGIGTHFTNDYPDALNIVIKMTECAGVPVVKLSDVPGKACGDPTALQVARWTFGLDN